MVVVTDADPVSHIFAAPWLGTVHLNGYDGDEGVRKDAVGGRLRRPMNHLREETWDVPGYMFVFLVRSDTSGMSLRISLIGKRVDRS